MSDRQFLSYQSKDETMTLSTVQAIPSQIKNSGKLPNVLSTLRLVCCWVPMYILLTDQTSPGRWHAFWGFLVILFTDWLDGLIARRWDQISKIGQVIDPLADKALVTSTLVGLCAVGILVAPWGWLFLAITTAREIAVTVLRKWRFDKHNLVIPANHDGKLKTALLGLGIAVAIMPVEHTWWVCAYWLPLFMSLWYSLKSAIAYTK